MTKQASDEAALKCHMPLEEADKIIGNTAKLMDSNALVILGAHVNFEEEVKPKHTMVKTRVNSLRSRLGRIMHKLYDLESDNEPEKPLNIDLDLYQMENF
ncbi:hypothetical protein MUO79_04615 [Candidatus Bathyarchaeota archaeon]|nr:hypothetical protein [Candidatus Bathyarchaeota archaeon]